MTYLGHEDAHAGRISLGFIRFVLFSCKTRLQMEQYERELESTRSVAQSARAAAEAIRRRAEDAEQRAETAERRTLKLHAACQLHFVDCCKLGPVRGKSSVDLFEESPSIDHGEDERP